MAEKTSKKNPSVFAEFPKKNHMLQDSTVFCLTCSFNVVKSYLLKGGLYLVFHP